MLRWRGERARADGETAPHRCPPCPPPRAQVKQKWGLSLDQHFRATSNARNEAMFREASMFAAHLRQVEKDLTAWERDIDGERGSSTPCVARVAGVQGTDRPEDRFEAPGMQQGCGAAPTGPKSA